MRSRVTKLTTRFIFLTTEKMYTTTNNKQKEFTRKILPLSKIWSRPKNADSPHETRKISFVWRSQKKWYPPSKCSLVPSWSWRVKTHYPEACSHPRLGRRRTKSLEQHLKEPPPRNPHTSSETSCRMQEKKRHSDNPPHIPPTRWSTPCPRNQIFWNNASPP